MKHSESISRIIFLLLLTCLSTYVQIDNTQYSEDLMLLAQDDVHSYLCPSEDPVYEQIAVLEKSYPQSLFDFDGDNIKEILGYCDQNDTITISQFSRNSLGVIGSLDVSPLVIRQLAAGNFDNDPELEIAMSTDYTSSDNRRIEIYEVSLEFDITHEYSIALPGGSSGEGHLGVGDTDGDSRDEILFTQMVADTGTHGLIDFNGREFVVEFSHEHGWGYTCSATVADLDGNGIGEAFFGFGYGTSKNGDVDIYNYSVGSYTKVQTLEFGRDPEFSRTLGDANNDGKIDMPIGKNVAYDKYCLILQFDGSDYVIVESSSSNGDTGCQPSVGDLDNDGFDELVYGHEISSPDPDALDVYQVQSGVFNNDAKIGPISGYNHLWEPRIGIVTENGINSLVIVGDTSTDFDTLVYQIDNSQYSVPMIDSPSDLQYEEGMIGNSVKWNPSATYPESYELYQDANLIDSGSWDGSQITHDLDYLPEGTYNLTLVVYNNESLSNSDSVIVYVEQAMIPNMEDHPSIRFEVGTTDNYFYWITSDDYPDYYEVFRNGTMVKTAAWGGDNIVYYTDYLTEGIYNFSMIVYDLTGQSNSDSAFAYVDEQERPFIDSPSDISFEVSTTGLEITWHPVDLSPDSYELFKNDTSFISDDWDGSNISVSLDGLSKGIYNYTLVVRDELSLSASDMVQVEVIDTSHPTIDSPSDIIYEVGSEGNWINWTVEDKSTSYYELYRNESIISAGSWSSQKIEVDVSGLDLGVYNYTIVVYQSNLSVSDTVFVTVVDTTEPLIDNPEDIQINFGDTGETIEWNPTDLMPDSFTIYLDGDVVLSGNWSGEPISYIIPDDLGIGTHNITICVFDSSHNFVSDYVIVTVTYNSTTTVLDNVLIVIIVGSLVVVGVNLIIIFKNRRLINSSSSSYY